MMEFIRKHKKLSTITLIILVGVLILGFAYGKYFLNIINNYILESKRFYFNSSVLTVNNKHYQINNWDGVSNYPITIDLNNRKTEDIYTTTDITYDISVNCPDTVICTLSKQSGVIHPEDEMDSYEIDITPLQRFEEDDVLHFSTSVESNSPYKKTMSASYTLGVQRSNFSYDIQDSANAIYLTINFTNAISFYEVSEAFTDHPVGSTVSVDEYQTLSPENQARCFSAIVTVQYNPSVLFVDMTNKNYLNRLPTGYQEQTIGGYQWVSKFSFKMSASSSSTILFYKNDVSQNYGYPIPNNNSIIQVSATLANS